jgi:hypothetical protein
MAANSEQYTIPLSIDPREFITGLTEMEAGLVNITAKAKGASVAISEAMTATNKSGDALVAKMNEGAAAAKKVSDTAKAVGVDLEKAFSPDKINTDGFATKVSTFVAKMKDAVGKPIDFKFNLDKQGLDLLVTKLKDAKGQMQSFELVIESAKTRLKDIVKGSAPFNELNKQIQDAEKFLNVLKEDIVDVKDELAAPIPDNPITGLGEEAEAVAPKTESLREKIRKMRDELAAMELAGKGGTEQFRKMSIEAGELQDQFGDTSQRIRALASDTKGLDAGITAIRGLAGAFAIGQGALAAFGEQNEEAARAIQKVQGAMAILQGIQEVANVLNKDSALAVYVQTFARKAHTEAIVAETVAVEAEAVATETATVATEAWTVALLANPITAIVAVLATAAFLVYEFAKSEKAAALSAEQFNKYLEVQQGLLQEDLAIINRRVALDEARANKERQNQSVLEQIRLNALKSQKNANQNEFNELSESISRLDRSDKDYEKSRAELYKRLEDLETKRKDLFYQIRADEINLERQKNEEELKLAGDLLKEKQANRIIEIEIATQAKNYLNEIQDTKISELRDGQEKELKILDQALKVKLQGLETEQAAKLVQLQNQRASLAIERELADTNGKIVIDAQVANLNREITLIKENGEKVKALEVELTTATEIAKNDVIRKYAEQRADIEFQVANTLLGIQKESAQQNEQILTLAAQHEIEIIERTNQDRTTKDLQQAAIEKKLKKDIAESNLDFRFKEIDIEKTSNENLLFEQKKFFDKSRDGQALSNYLLAVNQLEADEKKLKALKDAGQKEGDQEYENAKNAVLRGKAGVEQAKKEVKPQSIFEVLFPNDNNSQKNAENFVKTLGDVGRAVDAYANMQIANYQRLIDAQRAVVKNDEDQINDLKSQLSEEQALRDKGYSNNVDGIKKLIAEKNKQREEDVKKAEEYQKKMEKVQQAEIRAQTILQGVQLATAASNIFLASSKLGAAGVVIGGFAIAAMVAAFIAEKKAAYDAANSSVTSFGKGGIIKGKSHAEGGQKFYAPDGSGEIMELEAGEHVTSKKQTEKYPQLLDAINHDKLKDMDDSSIIKLLDGLGVHLQTDRQHKEALKESREHTSHQINQINIESNPRTPKELINIDQTLTGMANRSNEQVQTWEENGYIVTKKGNQIKRIRKH